MPLLVFLAFFITNFVTWETIGQDLEENLAKITSQNWILTISGHWCGQSCGQGWRHKIAAPVKDYFMRPGVAASWAAFPH
jgi:hypothetical protein